MSPLKKQEIEWIASKYVLYERLPHTLARLSKCEEFLTARANLLEGGYFDWHVFDAVQAIVSQHRFGKPNPHDSTQDLARWGIRMTAYKDYFYEFGDEPLPPPEFWTAETIEFQIGINAIPWLSRQGVRLPRNRGIPPEEIAALMKSQGFFEADPKPASFKFPRL